MKSALFVDFDNVFSRLKQVSPEGAERFARDPLDWMQWLVDGLENSDQRDIDGKRRILVRRCYLNPAWYRAYRHSFIRAGFEVIDCPPVTSQGKTGTDIHMVLDVIDVLGDKTHFDEFMLFSADADFTPVLRKLRRHDRRTVILGVGFPSAAYQAAADVVIDERHFVEEVLGVHPAGLPAPTPSTLDGIASTAQPVSPTQQREDLGPVKRAIVAVVLEAGRPVPSASIASGLRKSYPWIGPRWSGFGTFRKFFESLEIDGLQWRIGSGGSIDAGREGEVPAQRVVPELPTGWEGEDPLLEVASRVHAATKVPMLPRTAYGTVVRALAADLATTPFDLTTTSSRVAAAATALSSVSVTSRDVLFIVRGLQLAGHAFGSEDGAASLRTALVRQVLFLCEREQLVLDDAERDSVVRWISGSDLIG